MPSLVRQCKSQSLDADLSVSSEAAIQPHAPAASRNKCLRIHQSRFPEEIIIDIREHLLKTMDERIDPATRPMSLSGPDLGFGGKVVKDHSMPHAVTSNAMNCRT
jgi:hypothetical protein